MTAPFVVLACGNPSRGDDALGPLLLARLADWLQAEGFADRFELIEDFQFQIEHALDLQGRRMALFIDAAENLPSPFVLEPVPEQATPSHSTHAITPAAVLEVARRTLGEAPPPSWQLLVLGSDFELGAPPGPLACAHLELAWPALRQFCRDVMG